ncbi:putative ABC transporter permease [Clostridium estertheticum]|uniref:putative ABC transporter permease n=1 Tax=Clostridium estertheticum TaxID=238834 RepID=UPI001C7DE4A5|nr:putative ABC transporter permease [Clostridium estertheticum]MBX4266086.1 putative ABC transporter permease [Clostridium estertheticum]MBX4270288.1 putative ABC transporter permease [Clostridium estertheticum]WLC80832.1 putative ABC transporter permease [Clostridium estertheticum]WLC87897.1 putative ABC transporter permease [Clostridium estertheticum]
MIDITLLNFNVFALFCYFIVYSFMGWCLETVYTTIRKKEFVNRGFLHGPFCPIYGFAILSIIVLLKPIENNYIFLLLGSIFLTSLIEYITGYILETTFDSTWWDYSDEPYNLHGRICLKFSIIWGFISILILKVIHPYIKYIVNLIAPNPGVFLFYITLVYFILDFIITVITIIKLRSLLTQLITAYSELTDKLLDFKSNLGNTKSIPELRIKLDQLIDLAETKMSRKKSNIENIVKEVKIKYDSLFIKKYPNYSRIIKAFPDLKFKGLDAILKDVKHIIHKDKKG